MASGTDGRPEDLSGYIGDGREKFVRVTLGTGERVEHGDVYLGYSGEDFVVSEESSFGDEATTWYEKTEVARVEVVQHHSMCFITTAVAGDEATLDALRGFRDDAMARTAPGRALLRAYDAVSPSIADTLARHPDARTTRAIRGLVERCAGLARRRERHRTAVVRALFSIALTSLYVVGMILALVGHLAIAARESGITARESGSGSREG